MVHIIEGTNIRNDTGDKGILKKKEPNNCRGQMLGTHPHAALLWELSFPDAFQLSETQGTYLSIAECWRP